MSYSTMKKELGQYFTTNSILLEKVHSFIQNADGEILEPSCGAGHIVQYVLEKQEKRPITCIEIDTTISLLESISEKVSLQHMDFLEYKPEKTFATIIGNPPYVKRKQMRNIYIEFIDKCIDLLSENGELIFIIPSDFFQLTSASNVKNKMLKEGSITHVYHPHDETLFKNATQDIIIFRYQKTIKTDICRYNDVDKRTLNKNGNVFFVSLEDTHTCALSDIFDIKVGMVSGADGIFKNEQHGNMRLKTFNGEKSYLYLEELPDEGEVRAYLLQHKEQLMSRRIKKFNEDTWFQWGCPRNVAFMEANEGKHCLYCATITRKTPVFLKGEVTKFDGSLLCLLPKKDVMLETICEYLNSEEFLKSFKYAGRYKMGQKSLMDSQLPTNLIQEVVSTTRETV
jgi:adenine-specific DNA-methyltransferase